MAVSFNTVLLLSVCQLLSASADQQPHEITADFGKDVTLKCQAPNDVTIGAVEWTRTDLQKYVYFQRSSRPLTQDQDPSFLDRVQLKGQMEDGDLSLILKNVNSNDNGTYECRYKEIGRGRVRRAAIKSEPTSVLILNVKGQTAGDTEGEKSHQHLGVILPVAGLIALSVLAAAVGLVNSKKFKGRFSHQPVNDPDVQQQLQEKENSQSKTISINIADIQV